MGLTISVALDHFPCFHSYISSSFTKIQKLEQLEKELKVTEAKIVVAISRLETQFSKAKAIQNDFKMCLDNALSLFGQDYLDTHYITLNYSIKSIENLIGLFITGLSKDLELKKNIIYSLRTETLNNKKALALVSVWVQQPYYKQLIEDDN